MSPTALTSPFRRGLEEVPETLSSWDKCMEKSYCKYPVIVGIVVGSLVLIACIWCMARCLCCGAKCCGCGSKKKKPSKFADGPNSYQPPMSPPGPGPAPVQGFRPSPAPPVYDTPQFATFEASSGGKVNEDSLPEMPSWENAKTKRVEDTTAHQQDVELGELDATGSNYNGGGLGAVATGKPGRGGYAEVPSNPGSPVPGSRPAPGSGYRGTEPSPYINQGPTTPYHGRTSPAPSQAYSYGANAPIPYRTNSPYDQRVQSPSVYDNGSAYHGPSTTSPPPPQRMYSPSSSYTPQPYQQTPQQQQYPQQSGYRMYSPTVPSNTPPPPFPASQYDGGSDYQNRMETPLSMQAGRKPPPNTWRDV